MKRARCPPSRWWYCPTAIVHFVVVWRRHGRFVQIMDPATGRRWMHAARFLSELLVHSMPVPVADWREYAASGDFLRPLRAAWRGSASLNKLASCARRLRRIRAGDRSRRLDAGVRTLEALVAVRARSSVGRKAARVLGEFLSNARGDSRSLLVGAGRGRRTISSCARRGAGSRAGAAQTAARPGPSSPELAAALAAAALRPGRGVAALAARRRRIHAAAVTSALALAGARGDLEVVLFRACWMWAASLRSASQRLGAIAAVVVFSLALLLLEIPVTGKPAALRTAARSPACAWRSCGKFRASATATFRAASSPTWPSAAIASI